MYINYAFSTAALIGDIHIYILLSFGTVVHLLYACERMDVRVCTCLVYPVGFMEKLSVGEVVRECEEWRLC